MGSGDKKAVAGVVVGLAAGGVYMTGPLAFAGAPIAVWQGFFWLMVVILVTSGLYFALVHTIREDRAMPISFMVVGVILFFGGAIWLGIINDQTTSSGNTKAAQPTTAQASSKPDVLLIGEPGRLTLYNRSAEDLQLWGDQLEGTPASMEPTPLRIPKDGYYYFLTNHLEAFALSTIGDNGDRLSPLDIYLSTYQGKHYTVHCRLLIKMEAGKFSVHAQNLGIEAGGW